MQLLKKLRGFTPLVMLSQRGVFCLKGVQYPTKLDYEPIVHIEPKKSLRTLPKWRRIKKL